MMATTVTGWLDEAEARSYAVEAAEDAIERAEDAGENFAVTITALSVSSALEATAADLPAAIAALRAVWESIQPSVSVGPRPEAVEEWNRLLRLSIAEALGVTP